MNHKIEKVYYGYSKDPNATPCMLQSLKPTKEMVKNEKNQNNCKDPIYIFKITKTYEVIEVV